MVRKVDELWTKCRNSTDLDRTRAFALDGRDPRSWPQTKPCRGHHVLEQSCTANQHGAWISCARCALRLHYVPRHTARMTSVSTPSWASVQEALKRMSLLRDNDFTAKAVRDMIAEVEGLKPRKKKATPQTTIVYNTVYNSGAASSATISSGTPVRREISTPPSPQSSPITPLCREHPPEEGKDESPTGKCTDDGRGLVKTLSGRLARKLQRSASLVNAGLSKNIQTVLDAATVDRCDFVEICCSDAPCLTEAMQRRGLSSFSLLRSDGVGNHDAMTREKMLSWLSEKRPQRAWFSPPVITHQNNSTRCSLRSRQIFSSFSCMLQQSCVVVVTFTGNGLHSASVGHLSSCVNSELSRKVVVENCFMAACDSCFNTKKERTLSWNIIVGNSSHLILVSEST